MDWKKYQHFLKQVNHGQVEGKEVTLLLFQFSNDEGLFVEIEGEQHCSMQNVTFINGHVDIHQLGTMHRYHSLDFLETFLQFKTFKIKEMEK